MSDLETSPQTNQLPPPEGLQVVGQPIPESADSQKEQFLGASNAHMSPIRLAQMKANVESGINPGGFGRLPGVEAPELVVDDPNTSVMTEETPQEDAPQVASQDLVTGVPEHLKVAPEDKWVPPARSSDITPK